MGKNFSEGFPLGSTVEVKTEMKLAMETII
jgi:hypothetical protein